MWIVVGYLISSTKYITAHGFVMPCFVVVITLLFIWSIPTWFISVIISFGVASHGQWGDRWGNSSPGISDLTLKDMSKINNNLNTVKYNKAKRVHSHCALRYGSNVRTFRSEDCFCSDTEVIRSDKQSFDPLRWVPKRTLKRFKKCVPLGL